MKLPASCACFAGVSGQGKHDLLVVRKWQKEAILAWFGVAQAGHHPHLPSLIAVLLLLSYSLLLHVAFKAWMQLWRVLAAQLLQEWVDTIASEGQAVDHMVHRVSSPADLPTCLYRF